MYICIYVYLYIDSKCCPRSFEIPKTIRNLQKRQIPSERKVDKVNKIYIKIHIKIIIIRARIQYLHVKRWWVAEV